jgi:hypothetical protein
LALTSPRSGSRSVRDDNCEDDIAVADAAVDEEDSQVEEEGQGDSDYNSGFISKDMENYHGQCEHRRQNTKTCLCKFIISGWVASA